MEMDKLNKRYKAYRWWQLITFVLSIISCVAPVFIACICATPTITQKGNKQALCGVGVFFASIIVLVVFKSLVQKFISKLPYTLTALVVVIVLLLLMICLRKVLDDAIAILFVGLCGISLGAVFEIASLHCKSKGDEIEKYYKEMRGINV